MILEQTCIHFVQYLQKSVKMTIPHEGEVAEVQEMTGATKRERNNNAYRRNHARAVSEFLPRANGSLILPPGYEDKKLVGVDGKWYDVTNFIDHHPGGPVIEQFCGKDATAVFKGFHEKDVLKHRKPVGAFATNHEDPATKYFADLHMRLQEKGLFETSHRWYTMKISWAVGCLAACIIILNLSSSHLGLWSAGLCLFFFWQQCGFFMHDFMHSQWFHEPGVDSWLGTFAGTVCVGICGSWWKDEHFVHHALLNTVNYKTGFSDPQMHEDVWAHNAKLFPFFQTRLQWLLIKIQWITFLPLCTIAGRATIILDGFRQERRFREWVAFALHCLWTLALLSLIPTWSQRLEFYTVASVLEGILHVQLLISHYAKPFHLEEDICNKTDWYRMQVVSNINILNPEWLDWFHGGLNFHIEHHLFPRMPRHNYREASKHVREVCQQLNLTYDQCGWFQAVSRTLVQLKKMSAHFSLDPR